MGTVIQKEYHLVRIFPEQVHTFWNLIREAVIDSFSGLYGSIDEAEIASIQSEIMTGNIQAFGVVESTEDLKMAAVALTLISDEPILRKRSLVIIGIKSFGHVPDGVWGKVLVGAINIAKAENCGIISCVSKDERILKLCADNGFNTSIRWCFLEI